MKNNKEIIAGIIIVLAIFGLTAVITGVYSIIYLSLAFVVAVISMNLFSRKSAVAKTGAVILNTDLIYKILRPKKYKKAITKLEEIEKHEKI